MTHRLTAAELQQAVPPVIELRGRYGRMDVAGPRTARTVELAERDVLGPRALARVRVPPEG